MTYYHQINNPDDEVRLLKEIVELQTAVRARQEQKRVIENAEDETYSRVFQPITKTMESISTIQNNSSSAKPSRREMHENTIDKFNQQLQNSDEAEIKMPTLTHKDDLAHTHESSSSKRYGDADAEDVEDSDGDIEFGDEMEPSSQYKSILKEIKSKERDDGLLGMCLKTKTIAGKSYIINGNKLIVRDDDGEKHIFEIHDEDVWKLLVSRTPKNVTLRDSQGKDMPALSTYKRIAQRLNFKEYAETKSPNGARRRVKYQMLTKKIKGQGFLFMSRPPPSKKLRGDGIRHKTDGKKRKSANVNTVIIPSDNGELINALARSLGELHAGNSNMESIITPLFQEAKRRHLLTPEMEKKYDKYNFALA